MQQYYIERAGKDMATDRLGPELSCDNLSGLEVCFAAGYCRANPGAPEEDRSMAWYEQNVLKPLVEKNIIVTSGRFGDERKIRYDRASIEGGRVTFYMGHSHYHEMIESDNRSDAETKRLVSMGNAFYNDHMAFFPRVTGPTGIVISSDNKLIIGKRKGFGDLEDYDGLLQGVGSFFPFCENVAQIDPIESLKLSLESKAGIKGTDICSTEFFGLYSNPELAGDDLDFAYLVKTKLASNYFTGDGWKAVTDNDKVTHEEWYAVDGFGELQQFLSTGLLKGKKVETVFSTFGPLHALKEPDFS